MCKKCLECFGSTPAERNPYGPSPSHAVVPNSSSRLVAKAGVVASSACEALCPIGRLLTFRFLRGNAIFNNIIFYSAALYVFIVSLNTDELQYLACGFEGRDYKTFNTLWFTIMPLFILFVFLPYRNKKFSERLQVDPEQFKVDIKWFDEVQASALSSITTVGFIKYLATRFKNKKEHNIIEIILYVIASRGFIKALVLLAGKKVDKKNIAEAYTKVYSILQKIDWAVLEPAFDGVDFGSSMLAFVTIMIEFYYDASHHDTLPSQPTISLVVAIIGLLTGVILRWLDNAIGVPKLQQIKDVIEQFMDQMYFFINLMLVLAVCHHGSPIDSEHFIKHQDDFYAGANVLTALALINSVKAYAMPELDYYPPTWDDTKKQISYNLRWVLDVVFSGTGITWLNAQRFTLNDLAKRVKSYGAVDSLDSMA